jgi:cytochrome P450
VSEPEGRANQCDDVTDFDPYAPGVGACPYPHFARLRDERRVHRVPGRELYLVSRYADCVAVVKNTAVFSNDHDLLQQGHGGETGFAPPAYADVQAIYAQAYPNIETLHFLDPPHHTQQRRRINRWFSSKRAEQTWQPLVETLVDELISRFEGDGRVEFMHQFAVPLPIRAIAGILGVSTDQEADFKRWSDSFVAAMGVDLSHDGWLTKAQSHVEMQRFFMQKIEARIEMPTDDLLGELVAAATGPLPDDPAAEQPFTVLEVLNAVQHLLAAGNETTTQAIGQAMRLLVENQDQRARLRAEPDLIPNAVEEALRVETPTVGMWRYCREDTDVGGTVIPAGALVAVMFGSANRDDELFDDADAFRVDRPNASRHLAFGQGIHFCVGAPLARLELQVALRQLLERLPNVRLTPGARLEFGESFMLRNLRALPLEFDVRSRAERDDESARRERPQAPSAAVHE